MFSNTLPENPSQIWHHFYEIAKIPRPSGKEDAIRAHIIALAKSHAYDYFVDSVGNLIVYMPGSKGYEHSSPVAIQNHLDMVTVKTADKVHDFEKDPLQLQVKGRWLTADRTTLGADNGIGVAAAMALMTDDTTTHPPLELVFTVEEETGLHGAIGLDMSRVSAQRMINLDTEDWGEIFIGCAGGYGYEAKRAVVRHAPVKGLKPWRVHLKGLSGGHSGIQIHEQLGNANKLFAELLMDVEELSWQLVSYRGGVAHNVIAREAKAIVLLDESQHDLWLKALDNAKARWRSFLPEVDQQLAWIFERVEDEDFRPIGTSDTQAFLQLASTLPHGAQAYNLKQPADLVDLSCNLAVISIDAKNLSIQTSMRFFNEKQTLGLKRTIESLFKVFDMNHEVILDYPGWQPDFDSPLVGRAAIISEKITGKSAQLKAIHAGLECGILISKKPSMDMVSFGPTIKGAHSPTERLEISTVEPFWIMLQALLAELAVI